MNHDTYLSDLIDAHLLRGVFVEDLIHDLDLSIVVSGAQGTELEEREREREREIYHHTKHVLRHAGAIFDGKIDSNL